MDEIPQAEFLKLNNYVLRFLLDVMFFYHYNTKHINVSR